MADEEVEESERGNAESGGAGESRSDPENGPTEGTVVLGGVVLTAVEKHFEVLVGCIVENIKKFHLPSAKLLIELAMLLGLGNKISEKEYPSLAEVLSKACQEQVEEQGPGTAE